MATGNFKSLVKNTKNLAAGLVGFAANCGPALATYRKIKDRQFNEGPQHIRDQEEVFEPFFARRMICQDKNLWVDKDLAKAGVSQQDMKQYMYWKMDGWRVAHLTFPLMVTGGLALPYALVILANDLWTLSTFAQTKEERLEWLNAQDLNRYRWAPATQVMQKFWLDFHAAVPEKYYPAWEEIFEKNNVRRDVKKIMPLANKMYEQFQPYRYGRRQQARLLGRTMCMPTYPQFGKICLLARIKDYWEIALNEDYMVISQNLVEKMSDEELHDYAWRRFLAPYDKNLTREDIVVRVTDYHNFLGEEFVNEQKVPNLFILSMYTQGYYHDPAYLVNDISELEGNDYEHLGWWAKSMFSKRIEFENGPLRDQVEAHSQKMIADRQTKLDAAQAQLDAEREEAK